MTIFVNIQNKNIKNMWHKKLLESINWTHYLQDVIKLDGEPLRVAHDLVMSHASRVYEDYVKMRPLNKGYLATNLLNMGILPQGEPLPPLALTINEVEWAITHNYVHPRDVVVIKHKSSINLLKDISNDVLLTLLNTTNSESDVRMFHYLETELAFRNGDNPEFEDFTVKSSENKAFIDLKQATTAETKAAKYLYLELPKEEKTPREPITNDPLASATFGRIGISSRRGTATVVNVDELTEERPTLPLSTSLYSMPRLIVRNVASFINEGLRRCSELPTPILSHVLIFRISNNRIAVVPITPEIAELISPIGTDCFGVRDFGGISRHLLHSSLLGPHEHLQEFRGADSFFNEFTTILQEHFANTGG